LGKPLKITEKSMTRFLMPLSASVDLVLYALTNGENGNIYVKKSPASTVGDLAKALIEIFNYDKGVEEIGIRLGEKIHESLISNEEVVRVEDKGDYFLIKPEVPGMNYRKYYFEGIKDGHVLLEDGYTSANTKQLNIEEIKELLLSLDEVKKELNNFKK